MKILVICKIPKIESIMNRLNKYDKLFEMLGKWRKIDAPNEEFGGDKEIKGLVTSKLSILILEKDLR